MSTNITENNYNQRKKINSAFYKHLLIVFLVTLLICGCGLGFLWFYLDNYEKTTPNGSMTNYFTMVSNKDWDGVYEEAEKVFPQFNNKEVYTNYISGLYEGVDVNNAVFTKKSYSNEEYLYYDVIVDGSTVSTLQLRKTDGANRWYVRTLTTQRYFNFDALTPDTQFTVNGITITDDFYLESDVACEAYEGIPTGVEAPTVKRYYLDNLIDTPDVSVVDPDNYIVVKDVLKDWYYAGPRVDDATFNEYRDLIENAAFTYCEYITKDATYYSLRKLLYPDTSFYEAVASFSNQWFSNHSGIEFQNIDVYDVVQLSDEGFIGTISFDYVVLASDTQQVYNNTYQMTFLKDGNGDFLMTNLVLAN